MTIRKKYRTPLILGNLLVWIGICGAGVLSGYLVVVGLWGHSEVPMAGLLQEEQTYGEYTVRTYRAECEEPSCSYEILRKGRQVYAEANSVLFSIGKDHEGNNSLISMGKDITGDGKANLVIRLWNGAASSAGLSFTVFEIDEKFSKLAQFDAPGGAVFRDMDGDSNLEVKVYDTSYAFWNGCCHAFSPGATVVLRYREGSYKLAFDIMRKERPSEEALRTLAEKLRNDRRWEPDKPEFELYEYERLGMIQEAQSNLATAALRLIYSGNGKAGQRLFDMGWPEEVKGKEEAWQLLERDLQCSPYWPEIRRLQPGAMELDRAGREAARAPWREGPTLYAFKVKVGSLK